jgi:hypothetical protein
MQQYQQHGCQQRCIPNFAAGWVGRVEGGKFAKKKNKNERTTNFFFFFFFFFFECFDFRFPDSRVAPPLAPVSDGLHSPFSPFLISFFPFPPFN